MKKNLVLSILHGYTYQYIEPFIESFKKANVDAELVIFVSETISSIVRGLLKRKRAILIDYNSKRPLDLVSFSLRENLPESISINNYRFLLFLDFLQKSQYQFEDVILTDIRDVVFQRNPFELFQKDSSYFFLEGEGEEGTFAISLQNHIWSVEANGEAFTNSILDKMVSCAGVTAGSVENIINYLDYMRGQLSGRSELKWGIDQGIHNGYIYSNKAKNLVLSGNENPIVCTLGLCNNYRLNSSTEFITPNNEVYSMIHQYDRIKGLNRIVRKKYLGIRSLQILKKILYNSFS